MGLNDVFIPPEPVKKGGGGLFGIISGGLGALVSLAGLAAAPFTAGASVAPGLAAGGVIGGAGQMANSAVQGANTLTNAANAVGTVTNAASTATSAAPSVLAKIGNALTGVGPAGKMVDAGMKISGVGNMVGGVLNPKQPDTGGTPRQGVAQTDVASKRLQQDPRAMVATLNESISALKKDRYGPALIPFLDAARNKVMGQV